MIKDKEGIFITSMIIQAVAIKGTKDEQRRVAEAIADIPSDLVVKYWDAANQIKQQIRKAVALVE